MSLLPLLRGSPALLRGLQACASSCQSALGYNPSTHHQPCSSGCGCACCSRQFSTAASPSQPEQEQQQEQQQRRQETLQEIRARIFEQHTGDAGRTGRKHLQRCLKGPVITDWYMTADIGGSQPMLDDDMETQ